MSSGSEFRPISVEDYLQGGASSQVKHDYVDGRIYAMAGGKNRHNLIASRALIALGSQADGSPCDASVACLSTPS